MFTVNMLPSRMVLESTPAYNEGEYFVISNANMVMETDDIDEVVTVNEFVDIAIANNWVIEYQYI